MKPRNKPPKQPPQTPPKEGLKGNSLSRYRAFNLIRKQGKYNIRKEKEIKFIKEIN
jgi:hypothetical protein